MSEAAIAIHILAVDDDPSTVREIEGLLDDAQLTLHFADTQNAISRTLKAESIDLAVVHLHAGSKTLLDPLARLLREAKPPVALIALVDPDPDSAQAAAAAGVDGCVRIDDPRGLVRVVGNRTALIREMARQRSALHRVQDIHERYNLLLESSSEAIAYLHEGLHIYANPSYLELFGYASFEELEGFSILDLLGAGDTGVDLKALLKSLSRGELPDNALALEGVRADGSTFNVSAEFSPAHYDGEPCTQIMIRERLEAGDSAELQQELEKLRSHDLLTGLLNRQAFIGVLHEELEHPPEQGHMAVLLATLDRHATLQVKVGAAATDLLIRQSAEIFQEVIDAGMRPARLSDYVLAARIWFDERSEAEALATRVVENFSGRILEIHDKSPQVTASVGLAVGGSHSFTADELLGQAESALREAERTGGDSYVRYRPQASTEGDDEQWADKLRHALNNEDFRLVRLPITSMEDDDFLITEFETRLRLEGSDEIIMPSTFRPAAAEAGLAVALDRDLVKHLVQWRQDNPDAREDLLVPLSAQCLTDDDFIAWLQQLVDDETLHGPRLIFGFREPEVGERLRELQRLISRFAARGVKFALLGVSITARVDLLLKNVTVNYIKLAEDISGALRGEEAARQTLEEMVAAGTDEETRFIAPQVDNTSELAALWQFGITLVQDDFVRDED